MKDFQATAPGRLRAVSTGSKILYSAFALSAVIGLLLSWRLYGAAIGEAGPEAYYAGAAASIAPPSSAAAAGGPAMDLPDEVARPRSMIEQMPERKLLEVTHFHLFSIPVYVLILAHLWLLTKLPVRVQNAGAVLAVVSSGLHIAAPWIVRGHAALAWLMPVSGIAMLVTLGGMAVISVVDMWLPQPPAPPMNEALAEFRRRQADRAPRP